MKMYKVWSMRCDRGKQNYPVEYSTRVRAISSDEALARAKVEFDRGRHSAPVGRRLDWMVTRLP
jgi:hypothetical protein